MLFHLSILRVVGSVVVFAPRNPGEPYTNSVTDGQTVRQTVLDWSRWLDGACRPSGSTTGDHIKQSSSRFHHPITPGHHVRTQVQAARPDAVLLQREDFQTQKQADMF